MRVTLPVDPGYKTASEAATIDLLHAQTSIPVPKIIAYDLSRSNPIGFEWMLMNRVPGITLDKAWLKMSWDVKVTLIARIVDILAQMFSMRSNAVLHIK